MGKFVGAAPAARGKASGSVSAGEDPLSSLFPALFEYLTVTTWEDGSDREVATVMLFVEGALWKAWLNDRAEGRSAWASGTSSEAALSSLEGMLASGAVDWRVKPAGGRNPGKRA